MSVQTEPAGTVGAAAAEPVGRRERKKQATWLSLHDAAMALAVERGFEHVTVEDICDRADVSVRTFFNYFPCKEDAVLGGTQGFDLIVDQVRNRPADEAPLESLRQVYLEKMRSLDDRADWIRTRERLLAANHQLQVRELRRGESGSNRGRQDVDTLVNAFGADTLRAEYCAGVRVH